MDKRKILLPVAFTIFFMNLFNLDFDDLSWLVNKRYYIGMLVGVLFIIAVALFTKKKD